MDFRKIKQVNPKGNKTLNVHWKCAEAETSILQPSDVKSQLTGKNPDARKIEGKKRRGQQRMRRPDSINQLNGHEFEQLWETVEDRGA